MLVHLGQRMSTVMICLAGSFSIAILSYDAGMINNLNYCAPYLEHFDMFNNTWRFGLNAAIISAGGVFAGPVAGPIADRWGRKFAIAFGNMLIILGVILQASASAYAQFVVGRFLVGIATVIIGAILPMWVAEVASPRNRQVVSGLVMTAVPVAAVIICLIVLGVYESESNWGWRGAVLGEAVGPAIGTLLLLFVDESPRWLISNGQNEKAREIITRLHAHGERSSDLVEAEVREISETLEYEKTIGSSWKHLISPAPNRYRFIIATLTNIFYQIVGANMILYFLSLVIQNAGITELRSQILTNLGLVLWNVVGTFIGVFTINRFGRLPSLITGTSGIILCLAIMAILVAKSEATGKTSFGIGVIVIVAAFELFANISWMILAYTYPPEVLKYSQRAKGVGTAQAIGYAISFINLYTSPIALANISWKYYIITACWDCIILVVIVLYFKETKDKSLEQIDEIFEKVTHSSVSAMAVLNGEELHRQQTGENVPDHAKDGSVKVAEL